MKVLTLAGSLRKASLNKTLARWAATRLPQLSPDVAAQWVDLQPLSIPVYDGDVEAADMPVGVTTLAQQITAADGVIICTPEYNGSIPGSLKNVIDWLSRIKPMPLGQKPILLFSASPGALGGVRGLWHTRVPFEALGAYVMPGMVGVGQADKKLSGENTLTDDAAQKQLDAALQGFVAFLQTQKK